MISYLYLYHSCLFFTFLFSPSYINSSFIDILFVSLLFKLFSLARICLIFIPTISQLVDIAYLNEDAETPLSLCCYCQTQTNLLCLSLPLSPLPPLPILHLSLPVKQLKLCPNQLRQRLWSQGPFNARRGQRQRQQERERVGGREHVQAAYKLLSRNISPRLSKIILSRI